LYSDLIMAFTHILILKF